MKDRIIIEGRDGAFGAYIARPKTLPAPAVVVLHEVFGVNADIRKTCDELAEQGFLAVAPDLFWRQEPGVDLNHWSDAEWKKGLALYAAYDGGETEKYLDEADKITAPMLMHLAEEDEFISKEAQTKIKAALSNKPNVEIYSYSGCNHAFARHTGTHYNAAAAAKANGRTWQFLHDHLS